MNDRPHKETKLIAEAFHGEWDAGEPARFALTAAAHARRHRRVRRVTGIAALGAAMAAIGLTLWIPSWSPHPEFIAAQPSASRIVSRGYEIISDEELLIHLRGRPLLLVKSENGAQQIVLIESNRATESLQ